MKPLATAVEGVFGPRTDAEGRIVFVPLFHDTWLETSEAYRSWWSALADLERVRCQKQLEDLAAREQERVDADRRQAEAEEARHRERAEAAPFAAMQRRGVPAKDHLAIVTGALEPTQAMQEARALIASDRRVVLVLSGPKGTGKTTAAGWLVAQEIGGPRNYVDPGARRPESRFLDVSKLARLSRYKAEDIEPYETCTLLAIDDLGMEFADEKGSFLATLDGLFNARYAAGLYTVITTNLPAAGFKERYGERITDRIREVGRFVELGGKSLRGRKES